MLSGYFFSATNSRINLRDILKIIREFVAEKITAKPHALPSLSTNILHILFQDQIEP